MPDCRAAYFFAFFWRGFPKNWRPRPILRALYLTIRCGDMSVVRFPRSILLALACTGVMSAQEVPVPQLKPGSARKPPSEPAQPAAPQLVSLTVPKGASL